MSKISDLAQALHQKTMERKLRWEFQDENSIVTNIGPNSVSITRISPNTILQNTIFHVSIMNIDGLIVDDEDFGPREMAYEHISEIMARARRDSLRADETLDEIMEKVNSL